MEYLASALILSVASLSIPAALAGPRWTEASTGFPKSVSSLILNPLDTNVLYAGTHGAGVFRSGDGGATWAAFNDGLAQMDVWTLLVQTGAATIVYAGTPSGILKSSDM